MKNIMVDTTRVEGTLDRYFNRCVSASRAYLLLRADHREHLKMVHDTCGFEYVRFHGLLQDDMGIYRLSKSGEPIYSFQYCDEVYDYLLEIGMKPFVVFDFMPEALASGDKTIYWEKSNITPPADYNKWYDLIYRITQHFTHRYGEEEVKTWFFEVWNEPEGWFFTGDREEYFKLYEVTARAVKSVCPDYKIGGPSLAGAHDWLPALRDHCRANNIPLDFLTAHSYCLTDHTPGAKSDADCHVPTWSPGTPWPLSNLKLVPGGATQSVDHVLEVMKDDPMEIHYTEWGLTFCYWDPLHDSYRSPSHMLRVLKDCMNKISSLSFCEVSDVFEEDGPPTTNFHGGFGLLNLQGIPKPSYFAYRFLAMLGDTRLFCPNENTLATQSDNGYQLLTWNCDNFQEEENILYFGRDVPPEKQEDVTLTLRNPLPGRYSAKLYAVGHGINDPYTIFLHTEYVDSLSREQVRKLKEQTDGRPIWEATLELDGSSFSKTIPLRTNDVYLLTLERL